jgi:hypothetical protein
MDKDGDGVIMPHETCLTPADFALIAGYGKRRYTKRPYTNANASASNSTQGPPASVLEALLWANLDANIDGCVSEGEYTTYLTSKSMPIGTSKASKLGTK